MSNKFTGLNLPVEAYFLAKQVRQKPEERFVRITENLQSAQMLRQDLEFFLGEKEAGRLLFFSPYDHPPVGGIEPSPDIAAERIATLWRLLQDQPYVLIVPQDELNRPVISPDDLKKRQHRFRMDEEVDRQKLVRTLVDLGYEQETLVESPGDFAVRGAIIDVFTPQDQFPLRLEFDGDRLVAIRFFDPATQTASSKGPEEPGTFSLIPATDRPSNHPATLKDYLPSTYNWSQAPAVRTLWTSAQLQREWRPEKITEWQRMGLQVRLVCHTDIQAGRLRDLLEERGISHSPIEVGKVSQGFGWLEEKIVLLTEEEMFGRKTIHRPPLPAKEFPAYSYTEWMAGDYLVHEEYGVCRYHGLEHLKIHRTEGDYLELEFLGGDKLFLPVTRFNIVQKYIGGTAKPPLDSLRGIRWKRVTRRARREVFKIASELLKIHAQRELQTGTAFPPPEPLDEEFAAHFPYDETPDQARAIDELYKDMQREKPMDRLICGDVGYGKTEVAMRAAFKAVSAGKQVAFLVPTTILALQHFETFLQRFDRLAVSVGMLSRLATGGEQREVLAKLAAGGLDIVIGTHRLLRGDVRFKDLGLLIIDEEQHFGVRHKERIKKIRPTVDVLTLSATPIPRTLHMALIGLRDLSLIHTPPVDRLSIRTFLAQWDEALIEQAVRQELARGGQVFFVHNRVATLPALLRRLRTLLPDVTIAMAHGQMKERDLEKVMIDFLHRRVQVLLTTAIIESGIDVPNANTILIDRADQFGLAQLYQLRGRVGRSAVQAYCYLLAPDETTLTGEASKRLSVLTRYTELGAGFQIASHDLEIRGAGNLLGTSQAGFVEAIGYELYTKLLARSIRQLKGEAVVDAVEPEIQINVPAFLPETYIPDSSLRMHLYKRMAHLTSETEIQAMAAELADRFGPLPKPAVHLLEILRLKQTAVRLGLKSLKARSLEEAKNLLSRAGN